MFNTQLVAKWLEENERSRMWLARKVAKVTGAHPITCSNWIQTGERIPTSATAVVSKVTGIPLKDLILVPEESEKAS